MDSNNLQDAARSGPKRLACRPCQRRKIKCSRDYPCVQCEQAGVFCEQSSRKQRARPRVSKKRGDDLKNRVASLEKLVQKLQGDEPSPPTSVDVAPIANKYLASPFWSSLAGEVSALKDALEDDEDESEEETPDSGTGSSPATANLQNNNTGDANFEFILCGPNNIIVLPDALYEPDPLESLSLTNVFLDRVDRSWKLFHSPSLRGFMENGSPYLGREASAPCNRALKAAVHFSALSQLTDSECQQMYGKSRASFLDGFRRNVEMKLIQADPMNTTALPALQAFAVYVVAFRKSDVSRRSWALFGLIVRLARAFNLHREATDETFYMKQLRRRLWHNINVMDVFFALDRGSEPLIASASFSRPLPSNLNDADFNEQTISVAPREAQFTEMTFALTVEELSACIHRINFFEDRTVGDTWQQRLALAEAQQKETEEKYLRYCDPSDDFQRLVIKVAGATLTGLTLRSVRPLQHDSTYSVPPIDSLWVFELGLENLRKSCSMMDDTALAKWKHIPWVQWHPISVVLAGLCSIKDLDPSKEAEAWNLVDRTTAHASKFVADTDKGALWQPLTKLYKKAWTVSMLKSKQLPQEQTAHLSPDMNKDFNMTDSLNPLFQTLDTAGVNDVPMAKGLDAETSAALMETNEWLDWDAIITDMDTARGESSWLWV